MRSVPRPIGITFLSLFFFFGATMSALTAVMLALPGSALEPLWRLNPRAKDGLVALGPAAILAMLVVCLACLVTAVGLWRLTLWGYRCALTLLVINVGADMVNAVLMHDWRTLIGLPVGGAMIAYLVWTRRAFAGVLPGV